MIDASGGARRERGGRADRARPLASIAGRPLEPSSRRPTKTSTHGWSPRAVLADRRGRDLAAAAPKRNEHGGRGEPLVHRRKLHAAMVRTPRVTEREERVRRWSKPGDASRRRSTRHRPVWRSSGWKTPGSSTPTVRWPRCPAPDRRPRRSQHPRDHPPGRPEGGAPPTGTGSSSACRHLPARAALSAKRRRIHLASRAGRGRPRTKGVPLAITHIEDVTEQRRTADQLRWAAPTTA